MSVDTQRCIDHLLTNTQMIATDDGKAKATKSTYPYTWNLQPLTFVHLPYDDLRNGGSAGQNAVYTIQYIGKPSNMIPIGPIILYARVTLLHDICGLS